MCFCVTTEYLQHDLNCRNDLKDMRCIIFVERKITTRVLASLLGDIDFLSQLSFKPLAGKSAGLNEMNRKNQQLIVDSFRNGKVDVNNTSLSNIS